MISAEDALRIADETAQDEHWGRVDNGFQALPGDQAGAKIWNVHRKVPRLGADYWFQIDAESGAVLTKTKRGSR